MEWYRWLILGIWIGAAVAYLIPWLLSKARGE